MIHQTFLSFFSWLFGCGQNIMLLDFDFGQNSKYSFSIFGCLSFWPQSELRLWRSTLYCSFFIHISYHDILEVFWFWYYRVFWRVMRLSAADWWSPICRQQHSSQLPRVAAEINISELSICFHSITNNRSMNKMLNIAHHPLTEVKKNINANDLFPQNQNLVPKKFPLDQVTMWQVSDSPPSSCTADICWTKTNRLSFYFHFLQILSPIVL